MPYTCYTIFTSTMGYFKQTLVFKYILRGKSCSKVYTLCNQSLRVSLISFKEWCHYPLSISLFVYYILEIDIKFGTKIIDTHWRVIFVPAAFPPLSRTPAETIPLSDPISITRALCGALILPTLATMTGKAMFGNVSSNLQRTLLVSTM